MIQNVDPEACRGGRACWCDLPPLERNGGKVERPHRTDGEEFRQLLSRKDDVDRETKLAPWERFCNFSRPHGAFNGLAAPQV